MWHARRCEYILYLVVRSTHRESGMPVRDGIGREKDQACSALMGGATRTTRSHALA